MPLLLFIALSLYGIIYLTASRKGMIVTFVVLVALSLYWIWTQPVRRQLLQSVLVVIFFIGLGYWLYRSPEFSRLADVSNYFSGEFVGDTGLTKRFMVMETGLRLWTQRPYTGWGLDQFKVVSGYPFYAHNNYVELLVDHGLVGLLAYMSIFVSAAASLVRSLRRSSDRALSADIFWALTLLLGVAMNDMTTVGYLSKLSWIALSIVIGVALRARLTLASGPAIPGASFQAFRRNRA